MRRLPVLLILLLLIPGCLEGGSRTGGEPGAATKLSFTLDEMGLSNGGALLTVYPTADHQLFGFNARWKFDVAMPDDFYADLDLPCFAWSFDNLFRGVSYSPPISTGAYVSSQGFSEDTRVTVAGLGVNFVHVGLVGTVDPVHILVGGKNLDTPDYPREVTINITSKEPFTYSWDTVSFDCAADVSDLSGGTITASDDAMHIRDAAWSIEGGPGTLLSLEVVSDADHRLQVEMGDTTPIRRTGPAGVPSGGSHLLYDPAADHATVGIEEFTSAANSRLVFYGFTGVPEAAARPLVEAAAGDGAGDPLAGGHSVHDRGIRVIPGDG